MRSTSLDVFSDLRDGAWCRDPDECRSACRLRLAPGFRGGNVGCRVVLFLD